MSKYIKLEDALKEFNYGTDYPVNTIIDILYDLPTISEVDICKKCQKYDIGFEDGRLDMLQKLSNALMQEGKNEQSD